MAPLVLSNYFLTLEHLFRKSPRTCFSNLQLWEFIVIKDQGLKNALIGIRGTKGEAAIREEMIQFR